MPKHNIRNKLGTTIATRRLNCCKEGKKSTILVRIGRPRKRTRYWACPFYISNIGMKEPCFSGGVDGFQALIMALVGIRAMLDRSGIELTWCGGEKGESGFPYVVPMGWGAAFSRKIERVIDEEVRNIGTKKPRRRR